MVYLLKMVIFHGELLNNQMVVLQLLLAATHHVVHATRQKVLTENGLGIEIHGHKAGGVNELLDPGRIWDRWISGGSPWQKKGFIGHFLEKISQETMFRIKYGLSTCFNRQFSLNQFSEERILHFWSRKQSHCHRHK